MPEASTVGYMHNLSTMLPTDENLRLVFHDRVKRKEGAREYPAPSQRPSGLRALEGVAERAVSEDALGPVVLLDDPVAVVTWTPDLGGSTTGQDLEADGRGNLLAELLVVLVDLDRLLGVVEQTQELDALVVHVDHLHGLDRSGGVGLQFQHFVFLLVGCVSEAVGSFSACPGGHS